MAQLASGLIELLCRVRKTPAPNRMERFTKLLNGTGKYFKIQQRLTWHTPKDASDTDNFVQIRTFQYSSPPRHIEQIANGLIVDTQTWSLLAASGEFTKNVNYIPKTALRPNTVYSVYTAYPLGDGSIVTFYHRNGEWCMATANGAYMNNVIWARNMTFEQYFANTLESLPAGNEPTQETPAGKKYEAFLSALKPTRSYTFRFLNPGMHPFATTYEIELIQEFDLEKFNNLVNNYTTYPPKQNYMLNEGALYNGCILPPTADDAFKYDGITRRQALPEGTNLVEWISGRASLPLYANKNTTKNAAKNDNATKNKNNTKINTKNKNDDETVWNVNKDSDSPTESAKMVNEEPRGVILVSNMAAPHIIVSGSVMREMRRYAYHFIQPERRFMNSLAELADTECLDRFLMFRLIVLGLPRYPVQCQPLYEQWQLFFKASRLMLEDSISKFANAETDDVHTQWLSFIKQRLMVEYNAKNNYNKNSRVLLADNLSQFKAHYYNMLDESPQLLLNVLTAFPVVIKNCEKYSER